MKKKFQVTVCFTVEAENALDAANAFAPIENTLPPSSIVVHEVHPPRNPAEIEFP